MLITVVIALIEFRTRRLYQGLRGKAGSDDRKKTHRQLRGRLREAIWRNKRKYLIISSDKALSLDGIPKRALKPAEQATLDLRGASKSKSCSCLLKPISHLESQHQIDFLTGYNGEDYAKSHMVCNRLLPIVKSSNVLSERQYGFRCDHDMVDAISMVGNLANDALVAMHVKKRIQLR